VALVGLAAAVGGALFAYSLLAGAALLVAVVAVVVAVAVESKRLALLGLVGVLLARTVEIATAWGPTTYLDEAVTAYLGVVLIGRRLFQRRPLRRPPGTWMFVAFLVLGFASSLVSSVPLAIAAAGGILIVKGVLLYVALAQVDWTVDDIPRLVRAGVGFLIFALACAAVNFALPGPWSSLFANSGAPIYRSILPSLIGPFTHPLQFGNFAALAAVACAAPLLYSDRLRGRARGASLLFVSSVVAALLSFRRTAILGLVACLGYLALRRRHAGVLVMALLALPVAGIILYPTVASVAAGTYDTFVADATETARTRLTVDGVSLALQHFPFGVGFGRFGSSVAREQYSPEYERLGYQFIYGLGSADNPRNHGGFLTDTQWPAIIAEPGLVGAVFFGLGVWCIIRTFRQAARRSHVALRLFGLVGVAWSLHILLESLAYPVFVTAPTSPLLFGLGAIVHVMLASAPPETVAPVEPNRNAARTAGAVGSPDRAGLPAAPVRRIRRGATWPPAPPAAGPPDG
jgi:hypothetical protein